ncbi:hypothetical protein DER46DRAFT_588284 [Fusarium sp. MPI-SDFR-AT-0072]|nr:hypothetical protein DER46DRAFT_588284 [Fusarium sp. MPI-SDFR-AT-0072]
MRFTLGARRCCWFEVYSLWLIVASVSCSSQHTKMLRILPPTTFERRPQLARLNHVPRLLGVFRPCKLISPPGGLPSGRLETALLISEHLTPRVCHARQDFNLNRQDAQPPPDSIDTLGIAFLDNGNLKPILIYPNSKTRYLSYLASDFYR